MDIISYIAAFIFVIALIGAGAWLLRSFLIDGNGSPVGNFFAPREKRMGVVETSNVDGRRRLILIRRDDTEHLIMTGGPVDMVIETGITPPDNNLSAQSIKRDRLFVNPSPIQQNETDDFDLEVEQDGDEHVLVARGHERSARTE